ncbi:protein late bloomer [Drosophila tropicalis]|uniref:protein late bloomer n=1 Tax=Drosophila tropicalis TaxID=46794 RepID=UPI0035ABDCAE
MGCTTAIIKYLVFLFNSLCALLGIAVIVVNSLALKDAADETRPILIFFIVLGSVIFLISFFGCCGAIKESVCLSWTYAISLLVLLILTCILVFVYAKRIDGEQVAKNVLNDAWNKQKNGTDAMSFYQTNFHCCGVNGTSDYSNAHLAVPTSCYSNSTTTAPYTVGCLTKLEDFYEQALKLVKAFGWILVAIEAGTFVSGSILAISFNNEQRRSRY